MYLELVGKHLLREPQLGARISAPVKHLISAPGAVPSQTQSWPKNRHLMGENKGFLDWVGFDIWVRVEWRRRDSAEHQLGGKSRSSSVQQQDVTAGCNFS